MNSTILKIIVFVSGAVVMVFELVGSRIMAPYVGTSIYVWTALIGVILGSLSIGYAWGGRLADKRLSPRVLAMILAIAAFLLAFTAIFQGLILGMVVHMVGDIRLSGVLAALILFAPVSVALGMVSPYAIRLHLTAISSSGKVVGTLYAISTLGSIIGTFAAGFLLIPFLGSVRIIWFLSAVLFAASLITERSAAFRLRFAGFILTACVGISLGLASPLFAQSGQADRETIYNHIKIADLIRVADNVPLRTLSTDPYGIQGAVSMDDPGAVILEYAQLFRLADQFFPEPESALAIGGGTYTVQRDFLSRHPKAVIDVVEIDPGITEAAREYFGLTDDSRMSIYHQDGRTFLNQCAGSYDVVYLDAYGSHLTVPFHLTTYEALKRVKDILSDDGIAVANLVGAMNGPGSKFFRAEYHTYRELFPQVLVFPTKPQTPNALQNLVLFALKSESAPELESDNPEMAAYLGKLWQEEIAVDLPVLKDDYAPVDYYALAALNNYKR